MRWQGDERYMKLVRRYGDKGIEALGRALHQEAEIIMGEAKEKFVPVDTGTLRSTGYVSRIKRRGKAREVELVFGGPSAPYALVVHENPRAGRTGGLSPPAPGTGRRTRYKSFATHGQWRYLATPMKQARRGMAKRLAMRMRRILKAWRIAD